MTYTSFLPRTTRMWSMAALGPVFWIGLLLLPGCGADGLVHPTQDPSEDEPPVNDDGPPPDEPEPPDVPTLGVKLLAGDGEAMDVFGASVAISGDGHYAIVGAEGDGTGSAYVFVRDADSWMEQAKIKPTDGASAFGTSVAISGDGTYALVGSLGHLEPPYTGSVYVYVRNGDAWEAQARLTASDGASIGREVAVSADGQYALAVTGQAGYVFVRSDTVWTEQVKLMPSDGHLWDFFGSGSAISGDGSYVLIGAHGHNGDAAAAGAAYVFARSGRTWIQQSRVAAGDARAGLGFGVSVALSADGRHALIGAREDEPGDGGDGEGGLVATAAARMNTERTNYGSVYVFDREGGTWTEQAKFQASEEMPGELLGASVAMSSDGTRALIGALGGDASTAYLLGHGETGWAELARLRPADVSALDYFGAAVALSDDGQYALVASLRDDDMGTDSGSAYVYGPGG